MVMESLTRCWNDRYWDGLPLRGVVFFLLLIDAHSLFLWPISIAQFLLHRLTFLLVISVPSRKECWNRQGSHAIFLDRWTR